MKLLKNKSNAIIRACSIELHVHFVIFIIVICPIVALILPAIILYFNVFALVNFAVELKLFNNSVSEFISNQFVVLFIFSIIFFLTTSAFLAYRLNKASKSGGRESLKILTGKKGEELIAVVQNIWNKVGFEHIEMPQIKWFVNFNVIANAFDRNGVKQIFVSSSLWERIVKHDPLSEVILTHEMAHLIYGDILRFRLIDSIVLAIRKSIKALLIISIITTILGIILQIYLETKSINNITYSLNHIIAVPIISFLLIFIIILGEMALRRYGGFLASLMEIRADVCAGIWNDGLDSFTQKLRNDPTIHYSTLSDLGHSLTSLNLSHISESERIKLLNSPSRLSSPKLRYFVLTILFALALPLNSITPLFGGGSIDHLFIVVPIVAIHLCTGLMAITTRNTVRITWKRCILLGITLCVAMGVTRINLYQIGYVLTADSASLIGSKSFSDTPVSFSSFGNDLLISLNGLKNDIIKIYFHFSSVVSILLAIFSIRMISVLGSKKRSVTPKKSVLIFIAIGVCYITILFSYDPWRNSWFSIFPFSVAESIYEWTEMYQGIRLGLPTLFIFLFWFLLYFLTYSLTKKIYGSEPE